MLNHKYLTIDISQLNSDDVVLLPIAAPPITDAIHMVQEIEKIKSQIQQLKISVEAQKPAKPKRLEEYRNKLSPLASVKSYKREKPKD